MRFTMEDFVMFVPAAGLGERVKARGVKPFIHVEEKDRNWLAINEVINMVPDEMDVEIAVRREMGCPPLGRETVVHFIEPTSGQAQTVYRWLRTTRLRNFVLISNCDNVIDRKSIIEGIQSLDYDKCPGVVFTFRPKQKNDERWSYVRKDGVGRILEIAEKRQSQKMPWLASIYSICLTCVSLYMQKM